MTTSNTSESSSLGNETYSPSKSNNGMNESKIADIEIELEKQSPNKTVSFQTPLPDSNTKKKHNTLTLDNHQSNSIVLQNMDDVLKRKILEDVSTTVSNNISNKNVEIRVE